MPFARRLGRIVLLVPVLLVTLSSVSVSASASSTVGAPWVVAAAPGSVTLDWPAKAGSRGFRVYYARTAKGLRKHAASQRTPGSASRLKVTGLRAGTMYCFQVARSNGSGRSPVYCHPTTRVPLSARATKISIVTYNICGHRHGCESWHRREKAIIRNIRAADADVVAIQELANRNSRIVSLLRPYGYELAAHFYNEGIYYRPSKLVFEPETQQKCGNRTVHMYAEDQPDWDITQTYQLDGVTWTWDGARWTARKYVCRTLEAKSITAGRVRAKGSATASFATLRSVATGKRYTFVSAHITHGKSVHASNRRRVETRDLVKRMKLRTKTPIIYAGDFNSSRTRPDDTPGKEMRKAGRVDAYDRSTTYSRSYINSFNGYDARPRRGIRYGDHIDRVFVPNRTGVSNWQVVATVRGGRNVRPLGSDHHPVRMTLWLR